MSDGPKSTPNQPSPLADVLGAMPALCARLIAEHVPDPTGKRCRACTTAGTGSPGAAWPCRIRDLAESARDRVHRTEPARSARRSTSGS